MGKGEFESYACAADRVDSLLQSLVVEEHDQW
jgi:hypothetical protein